MKRLLVFILLMVTIEPLTYSQYTSLMLTYQSEDATYGISVSQDSLLKNKILECLSNGYLPIVIEGDKRVAWIYLNTIDDPRGYEDADDIPTSYWELSQDLFPLVINEELRKKLGHFGDADYKDFFDTIGVEYLKENDEFITKIDYDKFERFVYDQ